MGKEMIGEPMATPEPCGVLEGFILASPPHDPNATASMIAHVVHCDCCASSPSGQAFLAEFHTNPERPY